MTKTIFTKVMWVGRATTFIVGMAVILAFSVGVASTALAGTEVGARFDLGKTNTVNAISKLVGSVAGPSLQIDNNSTGAGATALDLQVEPDKAPMSVNSRTKVTNLNADRLDGQSASSFANGVDGKATDADKLDGQDASAFMPASTYRVDRPIVVDEVFSTAVLCDSGDLALSGYWSGKGSETEVASMAPRVTDSESVSFLIENNSPLLDDMALMVVCADLPPQR